MAQAPVRSIPDHYQAGGAAQQHLRARDPGPVLRKHGAGAASRAESAEILLAAPTRPPPSSWRHCTGKFPPSEHWHAAPVYTVTVCNSTV
jgi:hypothetical protein